MKTIRVGLIGYGYAGATFHAPIIARVPGMALTSVATSQPDKVRVALPDVRTVPAATELFADPHIDLVVVTSPNDSHATLARQALEAGKHVVVEKPFVTRSGDGQALIRLAQQRARLISVFHNRRWDGDFLTVQKILRDGVLGDLAAFESHFDRYRPEVRNRWRETGADGGGILYDLGPHLIDQALQLFGSPKTIYADLALQRDGARTHDYIHLVLGYGKLRVILHAACLVCATSPRFVIHGQRGSFVKHGLDPQEAALLRGAQPGDAGWGEDEPSRYGKLTLGNNPDLHTPVPTLKGCYEQYYSGIVAAIRDGQPNPVSAHDALASIRIIEAALQSEREGRTVTCG